MLSAVSLLTAVIAAAVWSRRPATVAVAACASAATSLTATAFSGPSSGATAYLTLLELVITLVVAAKAIRWLTLRVACAVGASLVVSTGLSPLRMARWLEPPAPVWETVTVCACFAIVTGLAVVAGAYLRALDDARARVVAATLREQRLGLARDLHDWFAHEVTGIVLEAQAGRLDGDSTTIEAFTRIEQAGNRALDSLDRALALMRSPQPERIHGLAEISDLVRRFAENGRMSAEFDAEPIGELRPETAETAHRVVAESLTNIRRHAGAPGHVVVRIRREPDTITVTVTDNGPVRRSPSRRGGTGLADLSDRVAALGGTLHAGPAQPAGWAVHTTLPLPP